MDNQSLEHPGRKPDDGEGDADREPFISQMAAFVRLVCGATPMSSSTVSSTASHLATSKRARIETASIDLRRVVSRSPVGGLTRGALAHAGSAFCRSPATARTPPQQRRAKAAGSLRWVETRDKTSSALRACSRLVRLCAGVGRCVRSRLLRLRTGCRPSCSGRASGPVVVPPHPPPLGVSLTAIARGDAGRQVPSAGGGVR
jgi:hypothetical protein